MVGGVFVMCGRYGGVWLEVPPLRLRTKAMVSCLSELFAMFLVCQVSQPARVAELGISTMASFNLAQACQFWDVKVTRSTTGGPSNIPSMTLLQPSESSKGDVAIAMPWCRIPGVGCS